LCRPCTRGWRITIDGAGLGGARLVSDVGTVVDPRTRIKLASLASTSIQNTTAVLNEPGRVRLSDHARATVGPLTVQLANRIITDAEKTVRSDVLRSPAAPFSENDLSTLVVLRRRPAVGKPQPSNYRKRWRRPSRRVTSRRRQEGVGTPLRHAHTRLP
jgi:hypothetical protein